MHYIRSIEGVNNVHHLHLWTITSGIYALSAHVLIDDLLISRSTQILKKIETLLQEKYSMEHTTLQFESGTCCDDSLGNGPVKMDDRTHGAEI